MHSNLEFIFRITCGKRNSEYGRLLFAFQLGLFVSFFVSEHSSSVIGLGEDGIRGFGAAARKDINEDLATELELAISQVRTFFDELYTFATNSPQVEL